MATIETFKVNKGLKYLVKARKDGYYDYAQVFGGTEEDTSVSIPAMTPYDGLLMTQVNNYNCADTVDFSNTILPWKWDYEKYLSTSKFALMPVGNYAYYSYVPALNKDITVVGSPTISSDFVVSNFSSSNYMTTTNPTVEGFNAGASTWYFKFKTGSSLQYSQIFQGLISLYVDGSTLWSWNTSTASAVNLLTLSTNTEYWIKGTIDGAVRTFYYSTDGETYTQCYTAATFPVASGSTVNILAIGYASHSNYFNGTIDLKGLKVEDNNGNTVFSGTTMVKDTTDNITFVGSPTFNAETMVVSNFSTSNYITTPVFNPANNPWEVRIKVKTGSVATQEATIFMSATSNNDKGIGLMISQDGFFNPFCSANGSTYLFGLKGTHQVQANTTYWLLLGWNGNKYYFKYSTNGVDFIEDVVFSSNSAVFSGITTTLIGVYSGIRIPFNGSIDLSETELLINGETFYKPEVTYLTNTLQGCTHNYTDTGQATTLNCFTVNGDESVILTPDTSYNNERFLGTVNIAEHDVYDYVDGEWRQK